MMIPGEHRLLVSQNKSKTRLIRLQAVFHFVTLSHKHNEIREATGWILSLEEIPPLCQAVRKSNCSQTKHRSNNNISIVVRVCLFACSRKRQVTMAVVCAKMLLQTLVAAIFPRNNGESFQSIFLPLSFPTEVARQSRIGKCNAEIFHSLIFHIGFGYQEHLFCTMKKNRNQLRSYLKTRAERKSDEDQSKKWERQRQREGQREGEV